MVFNFYFVFFLVGCGGGFGVFPKPSNAYLQSIEKMMGVNFFFPFPIPLHLIL
jgi:hypothetical protein